MIAHEERIVRRDDAFVEYRKRRFCGYLTSGRSPFANGRVTESAASARNTPKAVPEPSAASAAPDRVIN
jgi:hypothetical protein